jgi:hypothetical protein
MYVIRPPCASYQAIKLPRHLRIRSIGTVAFLPVIASAIALSANGTARLSDNSAESKPLLNRAFPICKACGGVES